MHLTTIPKAPSPSFFTILYFSIFDDHSIIIKITLFLEYTPVKVRGIFKKELFIFQI